MCYVERNPKRVFSWPSLVWLTVWHPWSQQISHTASKSVVGSHVTPVSCCLPVKQFTTTQHWKLQHGGFNSQHWPGRIVGSSCLFGPKTSEQNTTEKLQKLASHVSKAHVCFHHLPHQKLLDFNFQHVKMPTCDHCRDAMVELMEWQCQKQELGTAWQVKNPVSPVSKW